MPNPAVPPDLRRERALLWLLAGLQFTHLPRTGLPLLLVVSTLFMVLMSGRFIPLMPLVTTCVEPRVRGAFMRLSSAAQNLAAGLASLGAGALIGHSADGSLTGFGSVGFFAAGLTVVCVLIARRLRPAVAPTLLTAPA